MKDTEYREILWNLFQSTDGRGPVLRIARDEDELFQPIGEGYRLFPLKLPTPLAPTERRARAGFAREAASAMGRRLWQALPDEARTSLLDGPEGGARATLLKIAAEAPALADLPWEWLASEKESPLALRPNIRLVRSVPVRLPTPRLSVDSEVKVLLVVGCSRGLDDVRWREESAAISRWIGPPYEVRQCPGTSKALAEALKRSPHIVHFAGHAGDVRSRRALILGDVEGSEWVTGEQLAEMLPISVRLLCLGTCFTEENFQIEGLGHIAGAAANLHLPTTVTNHYAVDGLSVRRFWSQFYRLLAERQGNVIEAFAGARGVVGGGDDQAASTAWGSFALYVRDGTGRSLHVVPPRKPLDFVIRPDDDGAGARRRSRRRSPCGWPTTWPS